MEINNLIKVVASETNLKPKQINVVLSLLEEGNTVPFIARYRKEVTGNLDEEQIRAIFKYYDSVQKLEKKKEDVIKKIKEKGLLTDELQKQIIDAKKQQEVDDIYLPFKEKKKTKATDAIKNGLEPLASYIMNLNSDIEDEAKKYIKDNVKTINDALEGAKYIIAEKLSDNSAYRKLIREEVWKRGKLVSTLKKGGEQIDVKEKFTNYYDFSQLINKLPSYRILAINRGEIEKILTVSIDIDENNLIEEILTKEADIKKKESYNLIEEALKDAYKRLIFPSIKREIRKELNIKADKEAIGIFSKNLEKLILQKPLKNKWVLSIDPAYRTGCKLAVVNSNSLMEEVGVIFPHEPKNEKEKSVKKIKELVNKYPIEQIVIGNGTASRETEDFIDDLELGIAYNLISEAGASVYSASKVAQEEFPDLTVEYRSAISIARRIQDPMAELVKIDPKSIGVGQYQHDVNQKELSESLDFIMTKVVNQVGVDINTASKELLQYVSGLDKGLAKNIVSYKEENGKFLTRKDIKKVKRLGEKAFKQAAGFLKILDGENELDRTFIHPEDYKIAEEILKINKNIFNKDETLDEDTITNLTEKIKVTNTKINELINYLQKSNLDVRDTIKTAKFSRTIKKIEDLKVGDLIQGEVRNILEFGAFVDIGIKDDGLVHISEISDKFVKNVSDYLQIGDVLTFRVKEIYLEKGKVQLSLKNLSK